MLVLNSPQIVQETALRWKREGKVAFVPTMGALHEGHLECVRLAKIYGQKVLVSIFVNPLQFGENEDLSKYPRTLEEDKAKLRDLEIDLLFLPEAEDLYPAGFSTKVDLGPLSHLLCGATRKGHFEGVATVVLKLLNITQADFAVFGEKDFQQQRLMRQMVIDLNLPVSILNCPTVREPDGLAMSSRNRYLSREEREIAGKLSTVLIETQRRGSLPEASCGTLAAMASEDLARFGFEVEYVAIASENDLIPVKENLLSSLQKPRLFAAVRLGNTRLIDTCALYKVPQ